MQEIQLFQFQRWNSLAFYEGGEGVGYSPPKVVSIPEVEFVSFLRQPRARAFKSREPARFNSRGGIR